MTLIEKIQQLFPHKKINIDPSDSLLMSTAPYYLLAIIQLFAVFLIKDYPFLFIVIFFALLPLADQILSLDWKNPSSEERKILLNKNFQFKLALYVTVLIDWIFFFKVMDIFANYEINLFTALNLAGILFMAANFNSAQFALAHEIFHKATPFDRIFGTLVMSKLLYMHFTYEHIWGHHKKVATPEDPASAEKGIRIEKFILRSYLGSYKSVYNMEVEAGKPIFKNCAVLSVVAAILFSALMYRIYGFQGFCFYLVMALSAVFLLQAINYIEHYGLRREKLPNGQYQKVTIRHSWNAPHRVSNYILFKLQRHSDHHENCMKPYQTLVTLQDSPQLSHGYSATIMMSFFPSTWFNIMDPLVDQYQKLKTGSIDSEIRANANKLIRTFIIEMSLTIVALSVVSHLLINLGHQIQGQSVIG